MLTFRWTCSYMNKVWYDVTGDGPTYSVELRRGLSDYERKTYNAPAGEYDRQNAPLVMMLKKEHCYRARPIPEHVVVAFNAWLLAQHTEHVADLERRLAKCGDILEPNDHARELPELARGSAHYGENGWELYPLLAHLDNAA